MDQIQDNQTNQPQAPSVTPVGQATPAELHSSPGVIVMQWLTYAFWGWVVLGMSILTVIVVSSMLGEYDAGDSVTYGIAAVLVLFPVAFVVDFFYSKNEPTKKTGAASVVMVIHAVLFALFGIGALISIIFSIVGMVLSASDVTGKLIQLYSSIVIFLLYGATFLRTLNPGGKQWIKIGFRVFTAVTVGIIVVAGIFGPAAKERERRNDRLIEQNINSVKNAIESYARKNDQLPARLEQVTLNGDAKKLVDQQLVTYTPNVKLASKNKLDDYYYYELCANYQKELKSKYDYSELGDEDDYDTYISDNSHPAGKTCYKLKAIAF